MYIKIALQKYIIHMHIEIALQKHITKPFLFYICL